LSDEVPIDVYYEAAVELLMDWLLCCEALGMMPYLGVNRYGILNCDALAYSIGILYVKLAPLDVLLACNTLTQTLDSGYLL
jgi:hypothetical protein